MSYHIYTSQGIVLKRTPFGEANILIHILTRDLGLIMASAQSARSPHSKLNGALSEFSVSSMSCIKGKNGWKITDARSSDNFYFSLKPQSQKILAQITSTLFSLMPGEENNQVLYDTVYSGFNFLKTLDGMYVQTFECILMLRILYHLGYVVRDSVTEELLSQPTEWNTHIMDVCSANQRAFVAIINKGLSASSLA